MSLDTASRPIKVAARPFLGSTAGFSTKDDWRPLFASYSVIALVANSDEIDIDALRASLPEDTLFVFFNKVYKVLDKPFDGNALLAVRSGTGGPNILSRRGELDHVTSYFRSDRFLGIMCMRAGTVEKITPASAFGGVQTGHLDLADYFVDFYPSDHLPSSGFALAVWLCELDLERKILLAGFSAKRSGRWKIFDIHDWTFEQVVQRLLVRSGRLTVANTATQHSYAVFDGTISGHFGDQYLAGRSRSRVGAARKCERRDRQADLDHTCQSVSREVYPWPKAGRDLHQPPEKKLVNQTLTGDGKASARQKQDAALPVAIATRLSSIVAYRRGLRTRARGVSFSRPGHRIERKRRERCGFRHLRCRQSSVPLLSWHRSCRRSA